MEEGDFKILLVDDDQVVLEVAEKLLGDLPYTFMATSSPAKAIQILTLWEVAVLLCDLNMPEIDGIEVLAKAREVNPDIVSILVTGMADQDATIRAINEGGIWKYIAKPWKPEEMVALVKEGVERYAKRRRSHAKLKILAHSMTATLKGKKKVHLKDKIPVMFLRKHKVQLRSKDKDDIIPGTRYKIEEVIGSGGTGTVYKAFDTLLGMPVAIKVLSPTLAKDKEAIATLKEEARIAMQLSHRHIVRLHNLQTAGMTYYLVMEYVEGQTLRQAIQAYAKLPLDSVAQVVEVCADALSYAHRHGIVHKDLKPENLLLTEDGVLKIIDFGIAGLVKAQQAGGAVVGTPAYMSPEQIAGAALDARTDVFSLGVIVYELLTGCLPFRRDVTTEGIQEADGLADFKDLPVGIMEAVAKAMAPNREERWSSVDEFAHAFLKAAVAAGYDATAEAGPEPESTGA
jgi:serine/threonine-protein kinase